MRGAKLETFRHRLVSGLMYVTSSSQSCPPQRCQPPPQEVSQIYPDLPWVNHINKILNNPEITVDSNEIVNVAVPKYVREVKDLIPTITARIQANYMIWSKCQVCHGLLGI